MRKDDGHAPGHGAHGSDAPASNADLLAQMGYETRDIALNALMRWFIGLIFFVIFMTAVAYGTYKVFVPSYVEAERVSPLEHVNAFPPFPQVQAEPKQDIHQYRLAEDQILNGKAAMAGQPLGAPIHEAIDVMAEHQGIAGITGDDNTPLVGPGYPGSGDYTNATPSPSMTTGPAGSAAVMGAPKSTPPTGAVEDNSATPTNPAPERGVPNPGTANTENGVR